MSVKSKKYLIARNGTKYIKDPFLFILGNSEIIIEREILSVKIANKRRIFSGNLEEGTWKIEKVQICISS